MARLRIGSLGHAAAPSRHTLAAAAVALVALNLAAFHHAVGWGIFHNSDSQSMLGVAARATWREALGWITGPWIGAKLCYYYRPSSSWLMWGEWRLFDWDPAGYQAVSLLLHLIAALAFWRLAAALLGSEGLALIAALIFSLRPANVRTLAVLTAQPDLLAAAAMLLCLLALSGYLRRRRAAPARLHCGLALTALAAALVAFGAKEMSVSLPLLATLIIAFAADLPRRCKAGLLVAVWGVFVVMLGGRVLALSGAGYVPNGWRGPATAALTLADGAAFFFARPFAAAVQMADWWPLAMCGVLLAYAALAWRRPRLRRERVVIYGVLPALAGAAAGLGALLDGTWVGGFMLVRWQAVGLMLLYVAVAGVVIAADRRSALFVFLWGLITVTPVTYRVYNWSGKYWYMPQTFWALGAVLLLWSLVALARRRGWRTDRRTGRPSAAAREAGACPPPGVSLAPGGAAVSAAESLELSGP